MCVCVWERKQTKRSVKLLRAIDMSRKNIWSKIKHPSKTYCVCVCVCVCVWDFFSVLHGSRYVLVYDLTRVHTYVKCLYPAVWPSYSWHMNWQRPYIVASFRTEPLFQATLFLLTIFFLTHTQGTGGIYRSLSATQNALPLYFIFLLLNMQHIYT